MQELRFVAVSEDGRYAVLAVPGRSARFTLPIDERLRAVALGQTSRLAQYEIEVESPLRPKEIQARIRAGETVEEIADAAGIAVERVRWFEGPVLAERAYIADQAQAASVRRPGESTPGPRLGEISAQRLTAVGADPDDVQWDARKRGDGNWQVLLTFTSGGRLHVAEWMFDPRRRHVIPVDDNAARMSLPDVELPAAPVPTPGQATVTRLEPRVRHEPPASVHAAPAHSGSGHSGSGYPGPTRPESQPVASRPESIPQAEPVRVEAAQPVAVPFTPAPAPAKIAPATTTASQPPAQAAPPAKTAPPVQESPAVEEPAVEQPAAVVADPVIAEPVTQPAPVVAEPAPVVAAEPVPVVAAEPAAAADEPTVVAEPVAQPAAVAAEPVTAPAAPAVVVSEPVVQPAAAVAQPAAVEPVAQPAAKPVAQPTAEPVAQPAAAVAQPAATQPPADVPAVAAVAEPQHDNQPAAAAKAAEPASRSGRKAARGRRSSVPSWDEIMLGSSRQQD